MLTLLEVTLPNRVEHLSFQRCHATMEGIILKQNENLDLPGELETKELKK